MDALQPLLTVKNLRVEAAQADTGQVALVNDAHFELHPGEILAVVGPNGAGKSSLLKCLSGDVIPTKGEIRFNSMPLSEWSLNSLARSRATLPQLNLLNFPYTVEEVIALGRIPHSTGKAKDEEIVAELRNKLDLDHLSNRLYPQLSGGEKQRTQIARVLAQVWSSPASSEADVARILLLDEPTNSLDLGHQQQLVSLLKHVAKHGTAIVLVLHDLNIASALADKVLLMCCGEQVACAHPSDVFTKEQLTRVFGANVHVIEHPVTKKTLVLT